MKEKPLAHRCVEKGILCINSLPKEDLENFTRTKVLEVLDRKKGLQLNLDSEVCRISLAKEISDWANNKLVMQHGMMMLKQWRECLPRTE